MEDLSLNSLYRTSLRLTQHTSVDFHRYLYYQINWNSRLMAIKGARGVGKTTLMLQIIKEHFSKYPERALYISLDNLWFANRSLTEVIDYHYTHGGTHLFIDEVHKYPSWQTLMKNIYDEYPDLNIVFTGSSMLKIDHSEADLSRRMTEYTLHGLSFREFLKFEANIDTPVLKLEDILNKHQFIAMQLTSEAKILPLFEKYLNYGYYPFYKEDVNGFGEKLKKVVKTVLHEDIIAVEDISYSTIQKLQRMLMILAERVPQTPKMNELYAILDTTREQGLKMLNLLQRSALLRLLSSEKREFHHLLKPDKIYLDNPNLMKAITEQSDKGTFRETFFINQLSAVGEVHYPRKGDFLVNRQYIFEVGGKNKNFSQIKDIPNSFLAIDDVEIGFDNKIPLWMFGLLY